MESINIFYISLQIPQKIWQAVNIVGQLIIDNITREDMTSPVGLCIALVS